LNKILLIILSFVVAMVLTILPLPSLANWLRPDWVLLVLIFWLIVTPNIVGFIVAWIAGIFLDILLGSILGVHAFAIVVIAYIVMRVRAKLYLLDLARLTVVVFLLLLLYQSINYIILGFLGVPPTNWWFYLSCLSGAVFWPWLYLLLESCLQRANL
jgi:rod shape-determining protein MreD